MSAAGVQAVRSSLLVEVETDNGLIGIGEAGSAGGPLASTQVVVERELKPLLLGEDPLLIERLRQKMFQRTRQHGRRGIVMHAISGRDIALWDLAGKVAQLPVYRLLGRVATRSKPTPAVGFIRRARASQRSPRRRPAMSPSAIAP